MNDDAIVRLRAMEPEDLDFLYAMENDKEVWDVGCTNVPTRATCCMTTSPMLLTTFMPTDR